MKKFTRWSPKRKKIFNELKKTFFTGLLVLSPVALTIYIFYFVFQLLDGILKNTVSRLLNQTFHIHEEMISIPGLGILVLIILILITGMIARNYLGRKILSFGEGLVTQIPFINRIYISIREISQAILSEKREIFKKAVLIEYPRKGIYSLGLFTKDTEGPVQDALNEDVVSVFIPTTPNPTSGFLLFVPKSQVIDLNMSVEDAMKLIISGGAVHLNYPGKSAFKKTIDPVKSKIRLK